MLLRLSVSSHICHLQVLPVASESHLTIVDLVKSLHTLHTDTILQLVKEVVKKPHQIKGEQVYTHTDPQNVNSFTFSVFYETYSNFPPIRSQAWWISPCYSSAMSTSKGK